jgi:hypothetical protein
MTADHATFGTSDGLELVEPGLLQVQQWRSASEVPENFSVWAGVGRK